MTTLPIIIEANEVASQLDNHNLLIIDLRSADSYKEGHIPNAINMPLSDIVSSSDSVGGLLPSEQKMNQTLQKVGYAEEKTIIAVDDNGGPQAARLIWTLHAFGILNCQFLNGGMVAWMDEINVIDNTIETPISSDFVCQFDGDNCLNREQIIQRLEDPSLQIIDARTHAEYQGDDVRSLRGGHIPNAIHFEWSQIKNKQSMKLKPLDEISDLFAQYGINPEKETVAYCQTHMRSSALWIAMKALNFKTPKGYPGAWSDWGNNEETPIA